MLDIATIKRTLFSPLLNPPPIPTFLVLRLNALSLNRAPGTSLVAPPRKLAFTEYNTAINLSPSDISPEKL